MLCQPSPTAASNGKIPLRREVWALLDSMKIETVDEVLARRAGEMMRRFRKSHSNIGLGDYLIAATAETRGLELATLNIRRFPIFKGLRAPFKIAAN